MKPTTEWFRPPYYIRCAPLGDATRWLLVAEPDAQRGVYGVGYVLSQSLMSRLKNPHTFQLALERAALAKLHARIAAGDAHGEGELFDVFAWNPVFTQHDDGRVTIEEDGNVLATVESPQ